MNASALKAVLERRGLRLRRDLGQNYLLDDALADELVRAAGVEAGDRVIEVGAGLGVLTRALARAGAQVTAIEIDAGIVAALREEALLPEGARLVHADALKVDWAPWLGAEGAPIRVVANLPYSAASPLLRKLLERRAALADWSVMLQREVARRIAAEAGSRDYGSFAVLHALCVDAGRPLEVPPHVFFPPPEVHSSFVRLVPHARAGLAEGELERVETLARAAFGKRRKTVSNGLRHVDGSARPSSGRGSIRVRARIRSSPIAGSRSRARSSPAPSVRALRRRHGR